MKKIRIFQFTLLLAVIFYQGCILDYAQTIYGNGNVITKEREVEPFNKLKVSSGIDVYITQGDVETLKLEADENLHDVINTEVREGTLRIWTEYNIRKAEDKKVHLSYRDLSSIKISSAGDVYGTNRMKAGDLRLSLSSAGDLELELDAGSIDINISSSGDARLSGTTDVLEASLSSAGDLHAFELVAKKCKVNASSAGSARVNASEELDMSSSSAGDIHYKGDAKITRMSTSSAGSIVKN